MGWLRISDASGLSANVTTYTKRELNRRANENDVAQVLAALHGLGRERLAQEDRGGPLYVLFADFCWHTDRPLTIEYFTMWLDGLHDDEDLDSDQVAQACTALEMRS